MVLEGINLEELGIEEVDNSEMIEMTDELFEYIYENSILVTPEEMESIETI